MTFKFKSIFFIFLLNINLLASYNNSEDTLGNITLSVDIWHSNIEGEIKNNKPSSLSFKDDLGFSQKDITTFGLELKNNITWLPNVNIDYFNLSSTTNAILNGTKYVNGTPYTNKVSSKINYSQINTTFYGYLYQGPFEFNIGAKIKKINYVQSIEDTKVKGPNSIVLMPHLSMKIHINEINTLLEGQISMLSFGDIETKDYSYSISYRFMRNAYISYGYKGYVWSGTNLNDDHEDYNVDVKGSYVSCKVLF